MIYQSYTKRLFYPAFAAILTVMALAMSNYIVKSQGEPDFKKLSFKFNRLSAPMIAGNLDPTFDTDGKVATPIGFGNDMGLAVAVQADGKIVTAGLSQNGESVETALVRYNTDGTLDTSFGGDGKVTTPFGSHSRAFAVAIQADGKIVAAGDSGAPAAVFRYNSDGSLDTTFDNDGIVSLTFYGNDLAYAVAVQPDGKIVVAGYGEGPFLRQKSLERKPDLLNHTTDFALARLNPDGSLDTSFGTGGKVLTNISMGEIANAVVIQPDGKIVAAGWTADFVGGGLALVRYNSNGSPDTSFGTGGIVITGFGGENTYGGAEAVALQPDDKIVAAGYYYGETDFGYALVRYNADGSLDNSFDTDGIVTIPNETDAAFFGVEIQSNGKIVAAGGNLYESMPPITNDFAVFRYNSDGSPDISFGTEGKVTTDFGGFDDSADAVALQPDGKIIAAGFAGNGANYDFAVARYISDAAGTKFDYDGDGRADVSVFRTAGNGTWWVLQSSNNAASQLSLNVPSNKIVPADYDGDGRTDIAQFNSATGTWYLGRSQAGLISVRFGAAGDIPAPADYDGDGKDDVAVYRPSTGTWWILKSGDGAVFIQRFGLEEDKPVPADYDGDGRADIAVYRPSEGIWYLLQSTAGFGAARFGLAEDKPVVGDYDGDGKNDLAVYRPSTNVWYVLRSVNGNFFAVQFGLNGDSLAPADYDGDGKTDIAVFRNGVWYILQSSNANVSYRQFGLSGDLPTQSAFIPQ